MTFVVELRNLKKSLPLRAPLLWQSAARQLCGLPAAALGLLGVALEFPVNESVTASGGILALLCSVLTAAVSATLGLLGDTSSALSRLFGDHASPALRLGQPLSLCFGEPLLPLDICPEAGAFPTLSGNCLLALVACALVLFGCGFSRQEPAKR
jgi:hypothetical protein